MPDRKPDAEITRAVPVVPHRRLAQLAQLAQLVEQIAIQYRCDRGDSDTAADYGPDLAPGSRSRRHDSLRAVTAASVAAPRLYSVAEVCELLQCDSEDWLKDRVRSGEFPARRVCRHLRFSVDDIENIIAVCAVTRCDDLPVPTSRQRRKNPLVGVTGNVRVG